MAEDEKLWGPTEEELKEILEQHKKWVESEGEEGKQANLQGAHLQVANLQGAWLVGANLQNASLRSANLQKADLREANLQKADLTGARLRATDPKFEAAFVQGANLREANLTKTNLQGAHLRGAELQRAHLWRANLQGADLGGANLQEAYLSEANLQIANLRGVKFQADPDEKRPTVEQGADDDGTSASQETRIVALDLRLTKFHGADLAEANLRGAIFDGTRFEDADLTDADLTGGTRLSSQQVAGANVSGAKLPEDIAKFDSLKQVDEASQSTKRIFLAMLLACAYSALTIFSTTDAQLLPNSASSPLPIIGTSIPIAGFFGVAPAILLAMFFYFQLYLQDVWEDLAMLPAVFPDGTPLNKRVFPWLLNGLVQRYLPRLKPYRTAMYPLRVVVSSLLAWWAVPFTVALFWLRYLPRHDWLVTGFHVGFLVVAILFAAWSQGLAKRTVRDHTTRPEAQKGKRYGLAALSATSLLLALLVSDGALRWSMLDGDSVVAAYRTFVPKALPYILASPNADITESDVSTRLPSWFRATGAQRLDSVRGAQLKQQDLRDLEGRRAFLAKADLRGADLRRSNLREADLQAANLGGAKLQHASLVGAKLQGANLFGARLQDASLLATDLEKTNLQDANFLRANLTSTDLEKAIMLGANLEDAFLGWANLQGALLRGVRGWNRIRRFTLANIYSVKDAPEGFIRWAVDRGAVCIADRNEYEQFSVRKDISEQELRAAQKDCFPEKEQGQVSE